jgi:SagB-type dehydrogenase family enzyme
MKKINFLKNKIIISVLLYAFALIACTAQDHKVIKLLPPNKEGGKPLMKALSERQSNRDFIDKELTDQQLSDLLWAAYGVNRPDKNKRTAPSAYDKQEVDIYLTTAKGAFLYDAFNHSIVEISQNDIRAKTGKQGFVGTAAINLIYVLDKKKASSNDENQAVAWASVTAGAAVQNVYLYCASENLGCVVRGWVDKEAMTTELKLNGEQVVLLAQTVGYRKD